MPAWEDSSQQKLYDLASDCGNRNPLSSAGKSSTNGRCSIVELIDADCSGLQSVEPHHVTMSTKSSLSNAGTGWGCAASTVSHHETAAMLRDFLHAERDTTDQE